MRILTLVACAASLLALVGTSRAPAAEPSEQDKHFVKDAASGGMAEVRLGQYAADNASSDAVKKFGEHMVGDHSKANDRLKEVASQQGIEFPRASSEDDQKAIDKLEQLKGQEFDKEYASQMVQDHMKDIAAFEKEASDGTDPAVKAFAQDTLPVLKHHLEMAKEMMSKVARS